MTDLLRRTLRAALDGLSSRDGPDDGDETFALVALHAMGDALRARIPLPAELRRWLRTSREDTLVRALDALSREQETWTLPANTDHDPTFPFIVRRRDETESVRASLDWRAVTSPAGRDLSLAIEALDASLARFDEALASRVTASEIELLLGERCALDDRGWRARFRVDEAPSEPPAPDVTGVEPSPEVIDRWLREGAMSRFVHRSAERDAAFASRLRTLVDEALLDAREDRTLPVGFVAQRWRQMHDNERRRPVIRVHAAPTLLRAAATDTPQLSRQRVSLGVLAPLAASATVECDGVTATLKVFAEEGALASVSWGGRACDPPKPAEPWQATVPFEASPVPVVVTASNGVRLEFDVDLQPSEASRAP